MTPVIDCHAHIVPPEMWRTMLSEGARYGVDPVGTVKAAIAPEHQAKVLGGTLQRLLCLGPACGCGT